MIAEMLALLIFIAFLLYFAHLLGKFGFERLMLKVIVAELRILEWFTRAAIVLLIIGFFALLAFMVWAILKSFFF